MDFLKKAKAAVADAEELGDKFQRSFNFGKKHSHSEGPTSPSTQSAPSEAPSFATTTTASSSSAQTPGTSVANTSVPFSTAPGAPHKLPMTARKSIRDDYEHKTGELNEGLEKLLKTKWKTHVDAPAIYSYSGDTDAEWARENPGNMFYGYFKDGGIRWIDMFLKKFGDDGRDSINRLASSHTMTLEPTDDPRIRYCGCDFKDGKLRIIFKPGQLGVNSDNACDDLAGAINRASATAEAGAGAGGGAALSLSARNSIRTEYEAKIGEQQDKAREYLKAPTLEFIPNFEANFAKLKAYQQSDPDEPLRKEWESQFGAATLGYFKGFVYALEYRKFKKDDLLQEGFKDAVEKNEVTVRVVEPPLPGGKRYNAFEIEQGVFVMKTPAQYWWVNTDNICDDILKVL